MSRRLLPVLVALLVAAPASASASEVAVHGDPVAALPDTLITGPVTQSELGSAALNLGRFGGLPETWCGAATTDDDVVNQVVPPNVPHFKVVYAHAADRPDRFGALADRLQASVSLLSRYLASQSGGAKTLRFDLGTACGPRYADIETVALPRPLADYLPDGEPDFALLAADVREASPLPPSSARNLLVYADALQGAGEVAGAAESAISDAPAPGGPHDAGGRVAAAFGIVAAPEGAYAMPAALMHEAAHTLGAVQDGAPNATGAGHCTDEQDVMCYADGGPADELTEPCPAPVSALDCGGDDYFNPAPEPGSYLASHWNLFDSAHLVACPDAGDACGAPDVTPPANTTPAPPGGWLRAPYQVALSATDAESGVDRLQWRVGDGPELDAEHGEAITLPDDGVHALWTRAIDRAGNASEWRMDTVRIDASAPIDTTAAGTLAWRGAPTAVTVTAVDVPSGVHRVEWRLDDQPAKTGPSGSTVPIDGDGEHALLTRAVDVAGNASAWRTHTVRVDTVTPVDETSAPGGWQTSPLNVMVTGSDAHSSIAAVCWRLNGGAVQSGPAGTVVTVSANGEHSLSTQVVDAAGNATGWKDHIVRIDTTAPVDATPAGDGAWRAAPYSVRVSGADGVSGLRHMEWRIGDLEYSRPSGTQVTVSGNGVHTFATRAVDVAGNASGWREDTVRIDTLAPTDTTAAAPAGPVPNPCRVAVTGADEHAGVDHVEWRIDDGQARSGPSGSVAVVKGHGQHKLETRVVDRAGNESAWRIATIVVDVALNQDVTPPTDTTTTIDPNRWHTRDVTLTVSAEDSESGVERLEWILDGRPIESHEGESATLTISTEGVHHLKTRAFDFAGNASQAREQVIRVDKSVPVDTTELGSGWRAQRTVALTGGDAWSGVKEFQYELNGGPRQATAGGVVDLGADGEHQLRHRVIDHAGQVSAWRSHTVRIDTVAPSNTTAVPGGEWRAAALELALAGTDDGSGLARVEWRLGAGPVRREGGPAVVAADGVHALSTRAVDAAGNASPWRTDTVRVDVTAPRNTTPAAPGGWRAGPYGVRVAGADGAGSGVARLQWSVDGGPVRDQPAASVAGDGVHTLRTRVVDRVVHASPWRAETIRIDGAAPTAGVGCERADAASHRCRAAASDALSGVASIAYGVDGGPWRPVGDDGVFAVPEGEVRVRALDAAGNEAVSEPVRLAGLVRSASRPVHLHGRSDRRGMVGALAASRSGGDVAVDLRPLAVGPGRYRVRLRLAAGKPKRTLARTVRVGEDGTLPRLRAALAGATGRCTVTLTVRKRVSGGWLPYASARVALPG